MKAEIMCKDQSISTKKKKKREKQRQETLIDKQSNTDADCEHVTEDVSLGCVPDSSRKKKHKKRKHNSEDGDEQCKEETGGKLKEKHLNFEDIHRKQKTHDTEQTAQPNFDAGVDDRKIKAKKKRRKDETISTETSLAGCDSNEPVKKKKKSTADSRTVEIVHDNLSASLEKVETLLDKSKKEKPRKKRKADMHFGTDTETIDSVSQTNLSTICEVENSNHHKKKKKHSKQRDILSIDESVDKVHKKKHKNNSAFTCDSDNLEKNNGHISEHESKKDKPSKKQKLKKGLGTDAETQDVRNMADKQTLSSACEEENANLCKKKKKHSKHKYDSSIDESECKLPTKKQKNSAAVTYKSGNSQENINGHVSQVQLDKKESVSISVVAQDDVNHVANEQQYDCEEESIQHHKKRKKHSKSRDSSMVDEKTQQKVVAFESPSGINSNSESPSGHDHLKKTATNSSCPAVIQGQWQGNLFENSERQNKFLRLLGGMKKSSDTSTGVTKKEVTASAVSIKKKGLSGSLTSMVNTDGSCGANAAMSATAAASLNQKLEDQYNRAMNFKLSGKVGTGFGFERDPAEGKTFHIDINKSKSVKFND